MRTLRKYSGRRLLKGCAGAVLLAMAIVLQVMPASGVHPNGLIGLWHFDGNADDTSGYGHHGTIIGATPIGDGISGGAFNFDGNDRIDVGNLDFSGGEYTVSLWWRTSRPAVTEDWRMAIGKGNIPAGDMTFEIFIGDGRQDVGGGDGPAYMVWDGGVDAVGMVPSVPPLNARDGDWHMVTATYTAGSQKFYFDGCLVGIDSYPGPLPLVAEGVQIGGFDGFGPYHHPWIGDIDEVSIDTRVLGADEVLDLYELHRLPGICPGTTSDYSTVHNFSLTPGGEGSVNVSGKVFSHAFASTSSTAHSTTASAVDPALQPATFDAFGEDMLVVDHVFNNDAPAAMHVAPIGSAGGSLDALANASVPLGPAGTMADAQSRAFITLNPYDVSIPINGSLREEGSIYVQATDPGGVASGCSYAFSILQVQGGHDALSTGKITWVPRLTIDNGGGCASVSVPLPPPPPPVVDPVVFEVRDGQKRLLGTFLVVDINAANGSASLEWDPITKILSFTASDTAELIIDFPSIYTTVQGELVVSTSGGTITGVTQTESFVGLALPAVGAPATFSIPFEFFDDFGYDLQSADIDDPDAAVYTISLGGGSGEEIHPPGGAGIVIVDGGGCSARLTARAPRWTPGGLMIGYVLRAHHGSKYTPREVPLQMHLENEAGEVVFSKDYPVRRFNPGDTWTIRDTLLLPEGLISGTYRLVAGVSGMLDISWADAEVTIP